jgi:hypothetical protein
MATPTPNPVTPELGLASSLEDNIDDNIDDNIEESSNDSSTTSLNVSHLSEADRGALYASLMPASIQQPADIQKVYN